MDRPLYNTYPELKENLPFIPLAELPTPVTPAVNDHSTMFSANSVAVIPAAQVHMPITMGHLRPIVSDNGPVQSWLPPQTKP